MDDPVFETNWHRNPKTQTMDMTGLGALFPGSPIIHKIYSVWKKKNYKWEYYIANEFESKIEWSIAWSVLGLNIQDASCDFRKSSESLTLIATYFPQWTNFLMSDKE